MTYAPGTPLVTLTFAPVDGWWPNGAQAITLPVSNLYPLGGTPRRARTIARAREWAAYAGHPEPETITLHTAPDIAVWPAHVRALHVRYTLGWDDHRVLFSDDLGGYVIHDPYGTPVTVDDLPTAYRP